jgi:hypothetical protein
MADNRIEVAEALAIITYKNKKILLAEYSKLANVPNNKAKIVDLVQALSNAIITNPETKKQNEKQTVLGITDVTNLHFDMELLNIMKKGEKETTPYVKGWCIVGVTGLLKVAYNFVIGLTPNSPYKIFPTVEAAKEWLAQLS